LGDYLWDTPASKILLNTMLTSYQKHKQDGRHETENNDSEKLGYTMQSMVVCYCPC